MKRTARILSIIIAGAFALSCSVAAASETLVPVIHNNQSSFHDTQGIWCQESVELCFQTGLIEGTSATAFSPNVLLSNAQITVIAARLQDLLSGGSGVFPKPEPGEAWFMPAYQSFLTAAARANQTLPLSLATLRDNPTAPCVRSDFVGMLAAALIVSNTEIPDINNVSVVPDCYSATVLSFYNKGIVTGVDEYGSFNGSGHLNRGQAAAMLARIISPDQRVSFSPKPFDLCRDIFQENPDTVLFSINGEAFTVEGFSEYIIAAVTATPMHSEIVLSEQLPNSIRPFLYGSIVPVKLAESLEITLSEKDRAQLLEEAKLKDGYKGLSFEFWYFKSCVNAYENQLSDYYLTEVGADQWGQPLGLDSALGEKASELYSDVQITAAFTEISSNSKMESIQRRVADSPLKYIITSV